MNRNLLGLPERSGYPSKLNLVFVSRPIAGNDLETDGTAYYNFARFAERIDIQSDTVITQLADFYQAAEKQFLVAPGLQALG